MRKQVWTVLFCAALALAGASTAHASGSDDVARAVDAYVAGAPDATLVGGPGSAGYDGGFWIRGGDFSLKINLTLQARFEAWDWDDEDAAEGISDTAQAFENFGGDLSGFSLPRATLKLSGTAPCNICYYMELEFGHFGRDVTEALNDDEGESDNLGPGQEVSGQTFNFDTLREAWIEWCYCPSFNVRMGQVKLPTGRQAMVAPELQQFIDISLGTAHYINRGIGKTDRNRDHGLIVHGAFGCENEWSYMVSITNGDGGDSVRNVLDPRSSDNLAYGARLNWAFLKPIGYQEGALNQDTCSWYGEVGLWTVYYADRSDKPHTNQDDHHNLGLDLALGYGGWSLTAAYTYTWRKEEDSSGDDEEDTYLVQLGYHFPGTAWEVVARWSGFTEDLESGTSSDPNGAYELAFGVNYYLNGHANKLQLDVAFIETDDDDLFTDIYAGYQDGVDFSDEQGQAMMIRFQWQLAL